MANLSFDFKELKNKEDINKPTMASSEPLSKKKKEILFLLPPL